MIKLIPLFMILLSVLSFSNCRNKGQLSMEKHRENMVKKQIIARGIKDKKVLDAMKEVERHKSGSNRRRDRKNSK